MTEESTEDMLNWYRRRVKVLEDLLVRYRIGRGPSEAMFTELEETRAHIDSNGNWRGESA